MYKIYCDGVAIHDPSLDSPERLVFGATLTQQANMADSFSFTIYPNNPGAASIYKLVSTIEVYQDNDLLFRGRPIQSTAGWDNQQTITCEGGLALFNDTILRPYDYTGTVRGYLQMLVMQHNEQVPADKRFLLRNVTVTDPNNNIVRSNENYVVTLQEMADKLVNNLGGYMVVTYNNGWILDYLATNPGTTSQKITLAKNLLDYLREQNAQNIATALIPLGATDDDTGERITIKSVNSGKDYIVDQTAAAQYGLIFATETWDDVTVPANLLTKAQARLTDYTRMIPTIQLTAVDMSLADQSIEPIRLLDTVTVEDDQHTASGQYVVMQRTYNLSDPSADKVTFGGAAPTMSGAGAKAASEIKGIPARVLQTASDRARAILDAATDGAIQTLYNNDGVAYEMRINNSQDPDTATKWWRYNMGGWGFTPDGGQTYKIAATMDGALVASLITTGILQSDDNGQTFYLDLDNGVLKGNFSELKISGSAGATQTYANNAASGAVSNYDTSLNQSAVFNKLTNNGQTQGIFLQNGKIYINGEYLKAATVAAGAIVSGAITLDKLAQETTNKIDGANNSEQLVYISKAAGTTSVTAPTSWVTNSTGNQNTWTIKRPAYNSRYPVCFIATQRKDVGGAVTCTTPLIDDTTTIIDGGNIITGTVTANQLAADSVTANKIDVTDLYAIGATIAGWKISSSAIYKDVVDPKDSNTVYRVYLHPPLANNPEGTWVLSCQKSTNGGSTFGGRFILYSNGKASFGNGTTIIDENGKVSVKGGTTSNPNLKVENGSNSNYYTSITPDSLMTRTANYETRWIGHLLEVRKNDGQTAFSGTPEWGLSRLSLKLAGGYGGSDPSNPFYQVYLDASGLELKDQSGVTRCKLSATNGLSFYNALGNLTKNYPVV